MNNKKQLVLLLTGNEEQLLSRIPAGEGNYHDLGFQGEDLKKGRNSWFWEGQEAKLYGLTPSRFLTSAIALATKRYLIDPRSWRRGGNNPDNVMDTVKHRKAIQVDETTHTELRKIQVNYQFDSITTAAIWCIANYSEYMRLNGSMPAHRMRKRASYGDYKMVTIRVELDSLEEFQKVSEENGVNLGRVVADYVRYCVNEYGIHSVAGRMYSETNEPIEDPVDNATDEQMPDDSFDYDLED